MSFGIMRSEKRKMSDCRGIWLEANRTPDNIIDFPNSDIDWTKTGENVFLVKSDNFRRSIKEICSAHGIEKLRKDAVCFVDSYYGASPEFFEHADPETIRNYFLDCLKFAQEHLGIVFNAVIHYDEKTPHLAVHSVPIVPNKDGTYSLSAKRLMGTQTDYHKRQDLFYVEVSEKYGFERCAKVEDAVEKRRHYNNLEYKTMMREMELKEMSIEIANKTELIENQEVEIKSKTEELASIDEELQKKTGVLDAVFNKIDDIYKKFSGYAERIFSSVSNMLDAFVDKVFCKKALSEKDFLDANLRAELVSDSDDSSNPLLCPITLTGERVTWQGNSPVYEELEPDFLVAYGSIDSDNVMESECFFDWSERFMPANLDAISGKFFESLTDLESLHEDIADVLGKKDVEVEEDSNHDDSFSDLDKSDEDDNDLS